MDAIATVNRTIDQITVEFNSCKQVVAVNFVRMGQLLIEAKAMLPHGQWGDWLKEKVEFSERSAQNFMRVAREYASNPQLVADLGSIRKAVALLDVPAADREAFAEEHNASSCSVRALEEAIKARDKAQEDLAAKDAALKTANSCLEGKNAELAQIRRELESLKNKPVDVAVETVVDEAAIKKAAKAAANEAKAKAEAEAAKALDAERAKVQDLEKQLAAAKESSDTDRAEKAEAMLVQLRRQLAIAQNEHVTGVQVCFEQIKEAANRMQGHILLLKTRGQQEEYERCVNAWKVLAQTMLQAADAV